MKAFRLLETLLFGKKVTQKRGEFLASVALLRDAEFEKTGREIKKIISELYGGRSLRIRAVDAGSTNAEEIELTALTNAYYDIDRFGLSFVASPRHADMLFVTGPVTLNLERALRTTYESAPQPCIVVAIGNGAIDGGIWQDSYAVVGGVDKVIPVHLRIPGDPPTPTAILTGVLAALRNFKEQ